MTVRDIKKCWVSFFNPTRLLNKLNAVIANVEAGKHADAANQLRNDILLKMGGVESPEGDSVVWIIDRSSQRVWNLEVQDVVKALEMAR